MARLRLDERLVLDGLATSRSLAQRLVMAGSVRVNGATCDKASRLVAGADQVEVQAPPPFVSRGGEKLDNALTALAGRLEQLGLKVEGTRALDIGASTGGFTDCLLKRGARQVVAVDVGYGQLHPKLRGDPRVTVLERTNARQLERADLPFTPNLVTCDASFISLRTLLPGPIACMAPGFWGLVLVKPQFEAGRELLRRAGKGGVIHDATVRDEVVARTVASLRDDLGLRVEQVVQAHPPGPKGNVEFVALVLRRPTP